MTGFAEIIISPASFIYFPLLILVGHALIFILNTLRPKAFPPGPRGLPGLGNLLQVDRIFPFLTYGKWAKDYGSDTPLGVKKGATNVVVLNSSRLVRELFEKRGAVYSDRPWQFMNNTWIFKDDLKAAIFQNSSPWLTSWRRDFNKNFGPAAITRLRPIYEAETARLLVKLLEAPTASGKDLEAILVCWMMSVPCLGVCGRRPDSMGDHGFEIKQFRHCSDEYATLVAPNAGDLFPFLRYLPEFFGMAEWKERARAVREAVLNTGTQFLSAAREQRAALDEGKSIAWESVLAKMLREQREKNDDMFTVTDMGNTAFHIVSAATNTSLAVFSIMLLILAKDPQLQQRVRNEVLEVSGGATPTATDLSSLKYTEAFWNEVHRWRPVAPQGVAHAPSQDDIYNGHRIPKGTAIIMNVWNIHHSEEDYDEPEEFIPERFLQHPLGLRSDHTLDAAHLEASASRVTWDFGAGRRICPGMHSAKHSLLLGLAKVLWAFDILPPEGKEIDLSLETGFVQEIALHPKELNVVLKLRDGRTKQDLMDHYSQTYAAEAEVMGWKDGLYQ
uniref:Cytochrome P450 monooxygenase grgG n=1 Tax=Penicillium sp. TaxID=5081 RepID=GRGG_PENSQ|nr:RecName: Full=Cytochrome P450 monooxygenase grgG; AltName: Full=Gregatin A biosynthesis cluster protein G [Penicillium sp.]BCA42574.1 cytochrome P450 monooxygenase GrgG [Penicillium sp.]